MLFLFLLDVLLGPAFASVLTLTFAENDDLLCEGEGVGLLSSPSSHTGTRVYGLVLPSIVALMDCAIMALSLSLVVCAFVALLGRDRGVLGSAGLFTVFREVNVTVTLVVFFFVVVGVGACLFVPSLKGRTEGLFRFLTGIADSEGPASASPFVRFSPRSTSFPLSFAGLIGRETDWDSVTRLTILWLFSRATGAGGGLT